MNKKLPIEALHTTAKVESFCWRVEQRLIREGGFALVTGDPRARSLKNH